MYVSMYVRVSLYFIDIIIDIALIHRLPKVERRTRLGRSRALKRKIYGVSKTITANASARRQSFTVFRD